jgi:hypothetical protein
MRENRPYGSEGGARTNPPRSYPYPGIYQLTCTVRRAPNLLV